MMADFHLPDDLICNIVARLPAKPLLRFRCVSKYWNRTLSRSNFMKLRSRKSIILPFARTSSIKLIDDNVPSDDASNLIVERCQPFDSRQIKHIVVGTFNGLVIFLWLRDVIVYNPLTGAYDVLPCPPQPSKLRDSCGFCYGDTPDDLKFFRFGCFSDTCDVYNFREGSWSRLNVSKDELLFHFEYRVGHFVNGFLYWIAYNRSMLLAFNVKDMVLSEICPPFKIRRSFHLNPLGTTDGYLCSLQPVTNIRFDMWVMKEENQWSIMYSFEMVGLPLHDIIPYYAICILDDRRVLMWNPCSENFIIYDTSNGSCKTLNISIEVWSVWGMRALEYVETLVSPSNMCFSNFERRKRRRKCQKDNNSNK